MSTNTNASKKAATQQASEVAAETQSADPQETTSHGAFERTGRNRPSAPPRGRGNKRTYQNATSTNSTETGKDGSPSAPAAKKQTAADRPEFESGEREEDKPSAPTDIDQKHADDPQYASQLAPQIYEFLRHYERLVLPGTDDVLQPAKRYKNLKELRMRYINALFHMNVYHEGRKQYQVATDTIHLAIYLVDRFLERYEGDGMVPIANMFSTALFLASKYEDVEPVYLDTLFRSTPLGTEVGEEATLRLEPLFEEITHILMGPTTTSFVHRYLQAVDLEVHLSAVHTARYLCALGVAHFPLTGHYYSKIAAAAAFIAYNKYPYPDDDPLPTEITSTPPTRVKYPQALEEHTQYSIKELQPVVKELLKVASDVEKAHGPTINSRTRASFRDAFPVDIYEYYKKMGVVSTRPLPNFKDYFDKLAATDASAAVSNSGRETAPSKDTTSEEKENPEESEPEGEATAETVAA